MSRDSCEHIRSDTGSKFTEKAVRSWFQRFGVNKVYIEPGRHWGNGYIEPFNDKLRNELLNEKSPMRSLKQKYLWNDGDERIITSGLTLFGK